MKKVSPEQIDALLPQTQCGLCNHGGCMPYAEAIVFEGEDINLCPPGGIPVLNKLGKLLDQDVRHLQDDMREKAKPELLAIIREDECIGCTKCIKVCPTDAILGAAKRMHTVISDECTGCELCVPACPVDCIDMVEVAPAKLSEIDTLSEKADTYRERFNSREKRLARLRMHDQAKKQQRSAKDKKDYIQQALARAKAKKQMSENTTSTS